MRGTKYTTILLLALMLIVGLTGNSVAQKRTLLQEDVGYVNALQYGSTFNDNTISAAISAIGLVARTLYLPVGTWTVNQSITIPSTITLYIPNGTTVSVNAGVTLTLAAAPLYDYPYWKTGTGTLAITDTTWDVDVRVYGAQGDGITDDTSAISAAITGASGGGLGTFRFPCGIYLISSQLTLLNQANLRFIGTQGVAGQYCATLRYTSATNSLFHFDGQYGLEIAYLTLEYSAGAWTANQAFLRLDKSSGTNATQKIYIHDSVIQGTSLSGKNASLIFLDGTVDVVIERVQFFNARSALQGPNGVASGVGNIRIRDNTFDTTISTAPLRIGGIGWVIEGNRFLGLTSGAGVALVVLSQGLSGLTYAGNFHSTASSISGTSWIDATAGNILGGTISGNFFATSGGSTTCIRLQQNPFVSIGVTVIGNSLGCGVGVDGGFDVSLIGNYNASTLPFGSNVPTGNSLWQYPGFGAGVPLQGLGAFGIGPSGAASGLTVVCYNSTTKRFYASSSSSSCAN